MSAVLALAGAVICVGCGTVVRGTTEQVVVNSEPSDATIRTSLGHSCPMSPCTMEVSRKTKFTAFAEKPGYHAGSMLIDTKVSGGGAAGFAGNVLVGGIIGMGVDAMSGATLDHFPNPALIVLQPIDPTNPATPPYRPPPQPATTAPAAKVVAPTA